MRFRALVGLFVSIALGAFTATAQECAKCDCYHFPVGSQCELCCGVASGTVTAVTRSTVTIVDQTQTPPGTKPVTKTFGLKSTTRKNAPLKKGAPVTIYFHKNGQAATRVNDLNALHGLLVPGNEPDPPMPTSCGKVPPTALKVYLGSSGMWTSGTTLSCSISEGLTSYASGAPSLGWLC